MDDEPQLYSALPPEASLAALEDALRHADPAIARQFYEHTRHPGPRSVLSALSEAECEDLALQWIRHLLLVASPTLTEAEHQSTARDVGRIHATIGLERHDLVRSQGLIAEAIQNNLDSGVHVAALSLLRRRVTRDLAWQIESYDAVQAERHEVLQRITKLAWEAAGYIDLIDAVVDELGRHADGCAVCRPESDGRLRFESVAGLTMAYGHDYADHEPTHEAQRDIAMEGAGIRAWHSAEVERIVNYRTDPETAPFKADAAALGLRSNVAIPLSKPGHPPEAVLLLYSALPGGFSGAEQQAFVKSQQALLGFALGRIEVQQGAIGTVPRLQRLRWARLLRTTALQMHYQPLVDLSKGRVVKVEALARLQDGERLLAPGQFFPGLSSEDFLALYAGGLRQALAQRQAWSNDGIDLMISVNLPPSALTDGRYFDATQAALAELAELAFPSSQLTLEVVETEAVCATNEALGELARYKALGVLLAEDDLGAGHSSLGRLRQLPFDWIKIDRSIVSRAGGDVDNVLRFVYQLTRLGHSLGKSVIVEGVEEMDLLEAAMVLGVDLAQGYVIAKPMPAWQLRQWLAPAPALPDAQRSQSAMAKLARVLICEERLHLVSEDRPAFDLLAGLVGTGSRIPTPAIRPAPVGAGEPTLACGDCRGGHRPNCHACPLSMFFIEGGSARAAPGSYPDPALQQALLQMAIRHGSRSPAYQSARQRLVSAVMASLGSQ